MTPHERARAAVRQAKKLSEKDFNWDVLVEMLAQEIMIDRMVQARAWKDLIIQEAFNPEVEE